MSQTYYKVTIELNREDELKPANGSN